MATYTEPKHLGDVLITKVADNYTLQSVQLAAITVDLAIGNVLTNSGTGWQPFVLTDLDSLSSNKFAVLASEALINTSAQKVLIIARAATVSFEGLVLPEGITPVQTAILLDVLDSAHGIFTANAPAV